MIDRRWTPGLVCALALLSAPATAQQAAPAAPKEEERPGLWQVGPLFLTPRLNASRGYDSNPGYSAQASSDTTTEIGPGLRFVYPGARFTASVDAYVQFNDFRKKTFRRSLDRGGMAETELRLGSLSLLADIRALHSDSRFSIDIDEKVQRDEWGFGAGPRLAIGERLKVGARVGQRSYRFDSDTVGRALDREEVSLQGTVSYTATLDTTLSVQSEVSEVRFDTATDGAARDDRRSYRHGLVLAFSEKASLNGTLGVGLREIATTAGGARYRTPYFTVGLGLPTLLGIKLSGGRDAYYSQMDAPGGRNSYVLTNVTATTQKELPFNLGARASGQFEHIKYLLPVEGQPNLVEHRWTFTVGLGVFVLEKLWLGGAVHWQRRESPLESEAYQRRFYGAEAHLAL